MAEIEMPSIGAFAPTPTAAANVTYTGLTSVANSASMVQALWSLAGTALTWMDMAAQTGN